MMNDVPRRDVATLVVPQWGRLVEIGDRYEPYRLIDPEGAPVGAVAVWCRHGVSASSASQRRTVEAETGPAMPRTANRPR
ncbi:hypothetical protein ACWCPF_24640 [Streptomyces sp. NPDC001858]